MASAAAIAVAVGPLVGGLCTTYLSWRWVFAGEVVMVLIILGLTTKLADTPPEAGAHLDLVGTVLSALGLGLVVYGVLSSGAWGIVRAKPDAPVWLGISPVTWLILGGGFVLWIFLRWEAHRIDRGRSALFDPALFKNRILNSGLTAFFFQFVIQSGMFFVIPLFLSVALGLSAVATGVRLLPLSATLLIAVVGIPRLMPNASPRRVVRFGFLPLFVSLVIMIGALDAGAGPEIVTWPMLLAGLGIGALASQLGSITVSSVATEKSGEVGGIQNTVTNLGASIGTALAGAILISALTASFFSGISGNPNIPSSVTSKAQVQLTSGIPFVSDAQLSTDLSKAQVPQQTADAIVKENSDARLTGLRSSLTLLALVALIAMFFGGRIPKHQLRDTPSRST